MTDGYLKPPSGTEQAVPDRVLVVVAHPDDVDFGSGGTVATWTSKGAYVCYCIVTDGAAGSQDPAIDLGSLVEVRKQEQRAAAATIGVKDVSFLGYPDGRLVASLEVRRDIVREIRRVRPDRVVCQSPERNYDRIRSSHPDHLAAGEAALCAVYPDARNPYIYPELLEQEALEPFEVPEVWMMAAPLADRYVDITEHIEDKIAALLCHRSQIADPGRLGEMIRSWSMANAGSAGLEQGRLAEVFRAIDTR
ncbi:MAG: PIG-L family deacetylase [Actinomycetota bacterium]|nr:PIG-L family deacetylase [Actinomycetota bacterium]